MRSTLAIPEVPYWVALGAWPCVRCGVDAQGPYVRGYEPDTGAVGSRYALDYLARRNPQAGWVVRTEIDRAVILRRLHGA